MRALCRIHQGIEITMTVTITTRMMLTEVTEMNVIIEPPGIIEVSIMIVRDPAIGMVSTSSRPSPRSWS
jgi:hypothetical protein